MPKYSQYDVPNTSENVNFSVGQPDTSKLPIEWFSKTLMKLSKNLEPEALQYGAISGYNNVRVKLASWLTRKYYDDLSINKKEMFKFNHKIEKDNLFMTNGNTGALQLLMTLFMETGDEIIIENPTYFIAKDMFDEYGLNVNTVNMESDGLNVDELEKKIIEIIKENEKYQQSKIFLYTIPIHHNPTSITLSHEKRIRIANLCKKYPKLYVIADEVYHFLGFDDKINVYPMADYHPRILSLGSFSKLIAPGLRLGWIYQRNTTEKCDLLKKINNCALLNSSGGINPIGYQILESCLEDGSLDKIIKNNITCLSSRSNTMCEFLSIRKDDITFEIPKGGYFLWLKLNVDNTEKFLEYAIQNKVKFHPGIKFGDECENFIRLSFSYYDENDLVIGLERLLDCYSLYKKTKVSIFFDNKEDNIELVNEIKNNNDMYILEEMNEKTLSIEKVTDVIINTSSNINTIKLFQYLLEKEINKPILVTTDNLSDEDLTIIKKYALKNPVGLIPNFSQGYNKIKNILSELSKLGYDWNQDLNSKEIKVKSNTEEFLITVNKSKNNYKNCNKYVKWISKQRNGLHYEMEHQDEYKIILDESNKFLIIENSTQEKLKLLKDKEDCDFYIILNFDESQNIDIKTYNKNLIPENSTEVYKNISKYLQQYHKMNSGVITDDDGDVNFTFENNLLIYDVYTSEYIELDQSTIENITILINQLSGLEVIGISKYRHYRNHLIIELKNDVLTIDSDIIVTLGNIINSEKSNKINVDFISYPNNDTINIRSYSYQKNSEIFNYSSPIIAVDYTLYINEIKPNNNTIYEIQNNKKAINVVYHDDKYYYREVL